MILKNIQAYEYYLKANAEILKFTESSTNHGSEYLQSALILQVTMLCFILGLHLLIGNK